MIYGKRDGRYVDTENDWVVAQSVYAPLSHPHLPRAAATSRLTRVARRGNAIEILVALIGLLFLARRAQALTLFTASMMTFWKTVLYFLVEACSGWKYTKQSSPADFWLLFVLPSFFWLAGPLYVMYDTARILTASSAAAKRKSA